MKTHHGIAITTSWINFCWEIGDWNIQLVRFPEGKWFDWYSFTPVTACDEGCFEVTTYELTLFQVTLNLEHYHREKEEA